MSRRCRTAEFGHLVAQARAAAPGFNVTTDIIVGFPGESEDEWAQTLAFASEMQFGHIHIFAYSPRAGTRAAGMPGQISRDVKRTRSQQLHALAEHSRRATLQRATGRTYELLVEQRTAGGHWTGYTPSFLRVDLHADGAEDLENRIVTVETRTMCEQGQRLRAVLPGD
jgi:threonylcarbamoyladenosine tRNA methylthiotransferase MtaB